MVPNDPNQNPFRDREVQQWQRGHRPQPMSDRDLQRAQSMMQDSIARIRAYEHAASAPDPPSKRRTKQTILGPAVFGNQQDDEDLHDELVSYDWPTNLVGFGDHWLGLTNPGFRSPRDHTTTYPAALGVTPSWYTNTILEEHNSGLGQYTFPVPPGVFPPWPRTRAIAEMAPAAWYYWLTDQLTNLLGPTKPFGSSWQFDPASGGAQAWRRSTISNPTYSGSSYVEDEFQALAAALQSIEDEAKETVTSARDELPDRYEDYGGLP